MLKILIIEDEAAAARGLIKLLKEVDQDAHILDTLDSIKKSIAWFKNHIEPDLVFMDIQLKDGISFKIFDQVEILCPIIFCTAYDQYAIDAFRVNSIDYLLKPIDKLKLSDSIVKFRTLKNRTIQSDLNKLKGLYRNFISKDEFKSRFMVKSGKKIYHVHREDIAYIWTENKIVFLITHSGKRFVLDFNLEKLEQILPPDSFYRINRQYIVSIKSIKSVLNDYGTYFLNLEPKTKKSINVSKYRVDDFKKWIDDGY